MYNTSLLSATIHYNSPMPEPEYILGDADGDGLVSVMDATRIQKYKAQICDLDGTKPYTG